VKTYTFVFLLFPKMLLASVLGASTSAWVKYKRHIMTIPREAETNSNGQRMKEYLEMF